MWPFRRRRKPANGGGGGNGAARAAAESTARKRLAERQTPIYREFAEHIAALPPEDLVERVARMFGGRA